ncbi:MAG TPA: glycine cleavage system protein H [Candidatus Woesearchaeota archaeon]|nr:MAG: glycine cleavage system protein H [Candidatus Woesearchaeota archaeon]HDD70904.1 glycine cleavage system protein H [Candidatus Woesearchaeota archaeon]
MSEEDSWVKKEGNTAIVGLKKEIAEKVKEFVFIKLPEKGKEIKKGEEYVSVESVKWSGHFESPVSGQIIEVNESLFDEPSKINKDPENTWIMKVNLKE